MTQAKAHPMVSAVLTALVLVGLLVSALVTSQSTKPRVLSHGYGPTGTITTVYRLYHPGTGDHFYTNNSFEVNSAQSGDYRFENNIGATFENGAGTLFRLYNQAAADHFYTTNPAERTAAIAGGYASEGDVGKCDASSGVDNLRPVYRLWHPGITDHFYTLSAAERDSAAASGYQFEGIACFVR